MVDVGRPVEILAEHCTGCGRCVAVCPSLVLEMVEARAAAVRKQWCIGCGHCGAVCPSGAVLVGGSLTDLRPQGPEVPAVAPETLELLLQERRSVRVYLPEAVPEGVLRKILNAGAFAPTGRNSQNVHYVVLTSSDRIGELQKMTARFYERIFSYVRGGLGYLVLSLMAGRKTAEHLRRSLPKVEYAKAKMKQGEDRLFYHAPVVILAHAESWDTCSSFNCSVALYHCSLMAHALGLGCCFNGYLVSAVNRSPRIRRWLGIPAGHNCYAAMTLGFPGMHYLRLVHREPPKIRWD